MISTGIESTTITVRKDASFSTSCRPPPAVEPAAQRTGRRTRSEYPHLMYAVTYGAGAQEVSAGSPRRATPRQTR